MKLQEINCFGVAYITAHEVQVMMFTFTEDKRAYQVIRKYTPDPLLNIESGKTLMAIYGVHIDDGLDTPYAVTFVGSTEDNNTLSEKTKITDWLHKTKLDMIDQLVSAENDDSDLDAMRRAKSASDAFLEMLNAKNMGEKIN